MKEIKPLEESKERNGGRNPPPTIPKPNISPPAQGFKFTKGAYNLLKDLWSGDYDHLTVKEFRERLKQ